MEYKIKIEECYIVFILQEENFNFFIVLDVKLEFVLLVDKDVKNLIMDFFEVKYVDFFGFSVIFMVDCFWKKIGLFVFVGVEQFVVKKLMEIF